MRISTAEIFQRGVDAMLDRQREVSDTQLKLSTGRRINAPSDDPSAAVRILDYTEALSKLAQFQRNAEAARARLDQEESALIGIGNLLQRVRELAVQGNNDTNNTQDRASIAQEIRQHIDSFLQLANTQDANGEYLFSGFATNTVAFTHDGAGTFTYNGDTGQRMARIGENREVAMGDPGIEFMNLAANAGGTTNIGRVLYDLTVNLEAGNGDANALADLDTAIDRLSTVRAKIGARINAVDEQVSTNESFELAIERVRSDIEDLDYAEAISLFNQQLTALQASQQSFVRIQDLSLFNFLR